MRCFFDFEESESAEMIQGKLSAVIINAFFEKSQKNRRKDSIQISK